MIPIGMRPDLAAYRDKPRVRGGSKYSNVRTEHDGMMFDSKAELNRWLQLKILERVGEITKLKRQVPYLLIPKTKRPSGGYERECTYVADFTYTKAGTPIVEDVKGAATPEYRIKRKLMLHVHGIEVLEVK